MADCTWYTDWIAATKNLNFTPRDPIITLYETVQDVRFKAGYIEWGGRY